MPRIPRIHEVRQPTTTIAELYGSAPERFQDPNTAPHLARVCPFRRTKCDVSSNRHQLCVLKLDHRSVAGEERAKIETIYGADALPLGICSCWGKRQYETESRPWILCPKRLLYLEGPTPIIPEEVRRLIGIDEGRPVGVWSELKFKREDPEEESSAFFEYTFDFLLMELDDADRPIGPPYIIEVMTSSTRGGGLTEHMIDVLLGRSQRYLGNIVDSVYTPNYRQVFSRMLAQFVTKSEVAERWGGRAIWVVQDVLFDYMRQSTAFNPAELQRVDNPNVFIEVYKLIRDTRSDRPPGTLQLCHSQSVQGRARMTEQSLDFTSLLGLGYAPDVTELQTTLERGIRRARSAPGSSQWFKFIWGRMVDPREAEQPIA